MVCIDTCVPFLGALAMEALHRQVLPFLLRRLKEDVLQDLPPKIIQDYYCNTFSLPLVYSNFHQLCSSLVLVDAISCLFLIASIIFLGHGPSSSYWTEEGCKRLQIDNMGNTRGKDYGVGFRAALFESYSTVQIGFFFYVTLSTRSLLLCAI